MDFNSKIKTIEWVNNRSKMIDQRLLPKKLKFYEAKNVKQMYSAIKDMIVRGAPAIGIAGAHGVSLAAIELSKKYKEKGEFLYALKEKAEFLKSSRPTAVNLAWAVDKQYELAKSTYGSVDEITVLLINNGIKLENEDIEINKKMGEYGAEVVPKGATILTHCNAGALATVGYGTALGVIRSAYAKDPTIKVFADETRPRQQGARLTTWELTTDGIDTTLISLISLGLKQIFQLNLWRVRFFPAKSLPVWSKWQLPGQFACWHTRHLHVNAMPLIPKNPVLEKFVVLCLPCLQ